MRFVCIALVVLSSIAAAMAGAASIPGVANPQRAQMNYMLNCQGCHLPDGSGSANGAPSMKGVVAKFLSVEEGREYLTRVPGVANAGIPDDQLAELLNWTLATFDPESMPESFEAFTELEIAEGRSNPYVGEAAEIRERLLALIEREPDEARGDVATGVD